MNMSALTRARNEEHNIRYCLETLQCFDKMKYYYMIEGFGY